MRRYERKRSRTSTTVVWTLGTRETTLRPSVRSIVHVKEGVLLLDTEPSDLILGEFHHLRGVVTVVCPVGSAIVVVALGKDEDVVSATEGVLEDGSWPKVDIGVATRSLIGGRTVKVPDAKGADVRHLLGDSLEKVSVHRETGVTERVETGAAKIYRPSSWNGGHHRRQSRRLWDEQMSRMLESIAECRNIHSA